MVNYMGPWRALNNLMEGYGLMNVLRVLICPKAQEKRVELLKEQRIPKEECISNIT